MKTYNVGDLVRLTAAFQDSSGQPADPTSVELWVHVRGVTTIYANPVQDSAGKYHLDVPISMAGQTDYRWIGTGAVQSAAEGRFSVRVMACSGISGNGVTPGANQTWGNSSATWGTINGNFGGN